MDYCSLRCVGDNVLLLINQTYSWSRRKEEKVNFDWDKGKMQTRFMIEIFEIRQTKSIA